MEITDYNNNKYGTSFDAVDEVMNGGRICIMNIHFTAAQKIERRRPNWARFVFITVSGTEHTLRERLEDRGSETAESIENRLQKAAEEFDFVEQNPDFFDDILSNDGSIDDSVDELAAVLGSWYPQFESCRLQQIQYPADQRPIIICGPSGVGKDTLINRLREIYDESFGAFVSHTTRSPRKGEVDGVHYNFVNHDRFEKEDDFMEITDYDNNKYGTSFGAVDEVINGGRICIMNIHFTAAQKIERRRPNWARFIFITVSGTEHTLRERLEDRGSESAESIENRLQKAAEEFDFVEQNPDFFDHILSNDGAIDDSVDELAAVLGSWYPQFESCRLQQIQYPADQRPTIICGPSGVGKDTLISRLREIYDESFGVSVSHTTRSPRKGEENGVHYHFVNHDCFEKEEDFMEITDYNNNKYGTSFDAVDEVMNGGRICIMNIHFTAAQKIERRRPNWARFVFITVSGTEHTLR